MHLWFDCKTTLICIGKLVLLYNLSTLDWGFREIFFNEIIHKYFASTLRIFSDPDRRLPLRRLRWLILYLRQSVQGCPSHPHLALGFVESAPVMYFIPLLWNIRMTPTLPIPNRPSDRSARYWDVRRGGGGFCGRPDRVAAMTHAR